MGYYAGLPAEAYSLEAAICFVLMSILDVPTGMIADLFGRVISLKIGALFQVLSLLCLSGAIIFFRQGHNGLMWILLVIEAISDAVCNTLMSGAREAFYQDVVDTNSESLGPAERKKFRINFLSMSERYSRWISFFSAIGFVTLTVVLEAWNKLGYVSCLVMALVWYVMFLNFERVAKAHLPVETRHSYLDLKQNFRNLLKETRFFLTSKLKSCAELRLGIIGNSAAYFISVLFIQYLIISILRDSNFKNSNYAIVTILALSFGAQLGRLVRGYILPIVVSRLSSVTTIYVSLILIAGWSHLLLNIYEPVSSEGGIFKLSLMVIPTDLFMGMLGRTSVGLIQVNTPQKIRATLMSITSGLMMLLQGVYACLLGITKLAAPNVVELGSVVFWTCAIFLILFAVASISPKKLLE